jgi:hypothetical protein
MKGRMKGQTKKRRRRRQEANLRLTSSQTLTRELSFLFNKTVRIAFIEDVKYAI